MSGSNLTRKLRSGPQSFVLALLAVLLALQPVGGLALAQEPTPAQFMVSGVAGATLRADPDGASMAVAMVPAGAIVTTAGPDAVTAGVVWRQVRTVDGQVGFLPAGLLVHVGGSAPPDAPPAAQTDARSRAAPAQSVGAAPPPSNAESAPSVGAHLSQPAAPAPGAAESVVGPGGATSARPTPSPAPTPPTTSTTVERRRGIAVRINHVPEATAPNGHPMVAGRIIVRFKPGVTEQGKGAAHRAAGSISTRETALERVLSVQVDQAAVPQALAAYRSRADVAWAEPSYVYRALATPNDPLFPSQWGPIKIGAPFAWDVTAGQASTRVAILDSGIYTEDSAFIAPDGLTGHPDLRGKVVLTQNFSSSESADDWYGHGTMMAGIVAARANTTPAEGIAGVAYNVSLMNGKVLGDGGSGTDEWVANGIIWAADNGAHVISMSLGAAISCSPLLQAAVNHATSKFVVVVAAAGNGGGDSQGDPQPESPANCTHVIPVAAIDQSDARASFSNYGPNVRLAAPGVSIRSTDNAGTYSTVTGTSPATPHVGAVAALVHGTSYGTSYAAIVNRLYQTADPIVGTGSLWTFGRVNAAAAVGPASCSPRPVVTVTSAANGVALNAVVQTTGAGNAIRYIQTGAAAGLALNALISFPTPPSEASGTTTYVPQSVGASATFEVRREATSAPTTVPFIVTDGCGGWKTLVGGGTGAGF